MFSGGIGVANNIYLGGNINSQDIQQHNILNSGKSNSYDYTQVVQQHSDPVPTEGMVRFNTDYGHLEWYNGTSWTVGGFQDVTVSSRTTLSWQTNWVQGNYTVTPSVRPARGDRVRFFLVSGPKHDCCKEW